MRLQLHVQSAVVVGIADYADNLEWYDWDMFAGELTNMVLGL